MLSLGRSRTAGDSGEPAHNPFSTPWPPLLGEYKYGTEGHPRTRGRSFSSSAGDAPKPPGRDESLHSFAMAFGDPTLTKHSTRLTQGQGVASSYSQSARRYVAMCFALTIAWSTLSTPSSVMMRVIRCGGMTSKPSSSHRWRPTSRRALNLVVSQTT